MKFGINAEATWDETAIDVAAGDRLLIVTDGVSEAPSREGEMFGCQRLDRVLAESSELSVERTAGRINEVLNDFRSNTAQTDNVTILLGEMSRDAIERSEKHARAPLPRSHAEKPH